MSGSRGKRSASESMVRRNASRSVGRGLAAIIFRNSTRSWSGMCLPPLLIDSLPDAKRSCRHFALEDADDAGGPAGIFKFDRLDRSMRMGRPQETGVSLTGKSPIRDVRVPSAQQTLV